MATTLTLLLLALLGLAGFVAWSWGLFTSPRLEREVEVDGITRRYLAWMPRGRRKDIALPVVFAFHPGFSTPEGFETHSALHTARAASKFIVVYPQGHKKSWNAGTCCGPAMRDKIDEGHFVKAILNDLERITPIDRRRVYATGFSNGARLCYYLAGTMSEVFAAIAPVGGVVLTDWRPRRPMPIFHVHGLDDTFAPFGGGESAWKKVPPSGSVEAGIEFWRTVASAPHESHENILRNAAAECVEYSGGTDGTRIYLCKIAGLGHHWPNTHATQGYLRFAKYMELGPLGPKIDVNEPILDFLSAFELPERYTPRAHQREGWPAGARNPLLSSERGGERRDLRSNGGIAPMHNLSRKLGRRWAQKPQNHSRGLLR